MLTNILVKELPSVDRNNNDCCPEMFVVDFMGLVRKIPIKKQKLETFEDLAKTIFSMIVAYAKGASRIDIVS